MRTSLEKASGIATATCTRIAGWTASSASQVSSGAIMSSVRTKFRDPDMCGLAHFIQSVRLSKSREAEDETINKELSKIQSIFRNTFVDGYTKKKSVCKLLYIFLLGRKIDFGHSEALSLLSSNDYSEKMIGYLFISILFDSSRREASLLVACIKSDLESSNMKFVHLALRCIANICPCSDVTVEFIPRVFELIDSPLVSHEIKQSAILCYLNLYRIHNIPISDSDINQIVSLMAHEDLGVVLCVTSLIDAVIKSNNNNINENEIMRITVMELWRLICYKRKGLSGFVTNGCFPEPWLMVNLLRILQNFGVPKEPPIYKLLLDVLNTVVHKSEKWYAIGKTAVFSKRNVLVKQPPGPKVFRQLAVFLEAIGVIIQNTNQNDLWARASKIIEEAFTRDIPNLKYLSLDSMIRLCVSETCRESLKVHLNDAIDFLKSESDVSIKSRAVIFLYNITDASNVNAVVEELFGVLKNAEYSHKEVISLQIAIIAEKWHPNYRWYVDVMIKLANTAGEFIRDQVYSKLVQVVMSNPEIQQHATSTALNYLKELIPTETLIRIAGYFCGEYGHMINDDVSASTRDQFTILLSRFSYCNNENKSLLLSTFMKLAYRCPVLRKPAINIFEDNARSTDLDIQIRSVEYKRFLESTSEATLTAVFQEMPPLKDDKWKISAMRDEACSSYANTSQSKAVQGCGDASLERDDNLIHKVDLCQYALHHDVTLMEDNTLKIHLTGEYQGHTGQLTVTFENKISKPLPLSVFIDQNVDTELILRSSPIPNHLQPQMETKNVLTVECICAFSEEPTLIVEVSTADVNESLHIRLPVFVNKFFEPALMTEEEFNHKWISFESSGWVSDDTFKAKNPTDVDEIKSKLKHFKMTVLQYPSSRPNIMECAALFTTLSTKLDCLLRLKIEYSALQISLSVRSSDIILTNQVMKLLKNILS